MTMHPLLEVGSWENLAGSLGAGGGCIGADVAEVCGGTPGLLLAIFGLPLIGGGGGGGGKFFLTLPPTVDIVPQVFVRPPEMLSSSGRTSSNSEVS